MVKVSELRLQWSVLQMNIQGWFPIGLIGLISLLSKGLSSFLLHQNSKAWILWHYLCSNLHICTWLLDKKYKKYIALLYRLLLGKQCLCFNMLSKFVIVFLPRKKCLLISKLQSLSTVILVPPQNKICYCFHCFPIYFPWNDRKICHDLSFLNVKL